MSDFKPIPAQEEAWMTDRAVLLSRFSLFSHLLYTVCKPHLSERFPVAATDGHGIWLHPKGYLERPQPNRIFILAHEILHVAFDHCRQGQMYSKLGRISFTDGSSTNYDDDLANDAMDCCINAVLIASSVGECPKDACLHPKVTANTTWIEAYKVLLDEQQAGGGSGQGQGSGPGGRNQGPGQGQPQGQGRGGGFDEHLSPAETQPGDTTATAPPEADKVRMELQTAIEIAKTRGNLPAALARALGVALAPPVNWKNHLKGEIAKVSGLGGYDWNRPDRRLLMRRPHPIIAPGRVGGAVDVIVVACDTSGSISDSVLAVLLATMKDILQQTRPREVHVVWCDAKVHQTNTIYDLDELDTVADTGGGGGGTDFRPPFNWVDQELSRNPAALVYLTDLCGPAPSVPPEYPVIWACINDKEGPFGTTVHLDMSHV